MRKRKNMKPEELPAAEPVADVYDPAVSRAHEIVYHVEHQLNHILRTVLASPRSQVERRAVDLLGALRQRVQDYFAEEQELHPNTVDVRQLLADVVKKAGEP